MNVNRVVPRALLALVLLLGTVAPSAARSSDQPDDGCRDESAWTSGATAGFSIARAEGSCPVESDGDCEDCVPGCLCYCCALRAGAVLSSGSPLIVLKAMAATVPPVDDLLPPGPTLEIFHPPRV